MRKSIFVFIIYLGAASVLFAGSCGRSEEGAPGKAGEESAFTDPLGFKPSGYEHKPVKLNTRAPGYHGHPYVRDLGNLREVFLDSNKYQYAWAERIGINQIHSLRDAYRTGRPLVKITDCEAYGLDRLTHSVPFLVPEAAELLERIGYDFQDTLANRGISGYKIKVTSLLRTPATVKALRRVNRNATDSSTHKFGTTFDLSWSNFISTRPVGGADEGDLKNILGEVLYNLRAQGKCMVIYERKTACFHITVTPGRKPGEK